MPVTKPRGAIDVNPITAFLVSACIAVSIAAAYWVNPYVAFGFLALGMIHASSLKIAAVSSASLHEPELPRQPLAA